MNQSWINILNSFQINVQVNSKKEVYKKATAIQFFPYCNFKFRAKFHVCLFVYFDFLKAEYFLKDQNEFMTNSKDLNS